MLPSKDPDEETDRRLAAHLCVWCATALDDGHPDDTFCNQDCQTAWHGYRNGGTELPPGEDDIGVALDRLFRQMMTNYAEAVSEQHVDMLIDAGRAQQDDVRDIVMQVVTPTTPSEALRREAEDVQLRLEGIDNRPGIVVADSSEPMPCTEGLHVGWPNVGRNALEVIDAEPSTHPYPHDRVQQMAADGWHYARERDDNPLRAVRRCGHCGTVGPLVNVPRGDLDTVTYEQADAGPLFPTTTRMRIAQTCGHCGREHTGAPIVPMIRPHYHPGAPDAPRTQDGWEYAAVTAPGAQHGVITSEAFNTASIGPWVGAHLWEEACHQATRLATQWHCHLPTCHTPTARWLLLGAPLHWHGWQWAPPLATPLRVGLCTHHYYELVSDALSDTHLAPRMHMHHGTRTGTITIR
jgi:hypothetical protein